MAGRYELLEVAGTGGALLVQWEPGETTSVEDLQMIARGLASAFGSTDQGQITTIPGPANTQVQTVTLDSPKGPLWISMLACGGRRVSVMTGGSGLAELHRRVVPTIACHPDPSRESS